MYEFYMLFIESYKHIKTINYKILLDNNDPNVLGHQILYLSKVLLLDGEFPLDFELSVLSVDFLFFPLGDVRTILMRLFLESSSSKLAKFLNPVPFRWRSLFLLGDACLNFLRRESLSLESVNDVFALLLWLPESCLWSGDEAPPYNSVLSFCIEYFEFVHTSRLLPGNWLLW